MDSRSHYGFQLHGLRYHESEGYQLPGLYVLDWNVGLQRSGYHIFRLSVVMLTFPSWSLMMHWILAIANSCKALTYVTRLSCDVFGFYVAFIYLQKGIQVLTRQWAKAGE